MNKALKLKNSYNLISHLSTAYGAGQLGRQVKCQASHFKLKACKNMQPLA